MYRLTKERTMCFMLSQAAIYIVIFTLRGKKEWKDSIYMLQLTMLHSVENIDNLMGCL